MGKEWDKGVVEKIARYPVTKERIVIHMDRGLDKGGTCHLNFGIS